MKNFKFLPILALSLGYFSCTSDVDEPFNAEESLPQETFTLTVVHNGKTYDVPAKTVGDSIVYLDQEFSRIYETEIKGKDDKAVLTYKTDDGRDVVKYYASADELEKENGIEYFENTEETPTFSRGGESLPIPYGIVGRAVLYDDKTFKDRDITFDISETIFFAVPNLKNHSNFNDKTSSIRVFNLLEPNKLYSPTGTPYREEGVNATYGRDLRVCLIGYENSNYGGKILYCVSREYKPIDLSLTLEQMRDVYHCDWRLSKIGWNDKISSLVFRIIVAKQIDKIYIPHTPI